MARAHCRASAKGRKRGRRWRTEAACCSSRRARWIRHASLPSGGGSAALVEPLPMAVAAAIARERQQRGVDEQRIHLCACAARLAADRWARRKGRNLSREVVGILLRDRGRSDKGEHDEKGATARWHEGCSENRRETAKRDRKRRTPKGGRRLAHHTPLLKIPVWWRRAVSHPSLGVFPFFLIFGVFFQ